MAPLFSRIVPQGHVSRSHGVFSFLQRGAAVAALLLTVAPAALEAAEATFLVQLNDYDGENAYFSLYLVDPDGRYVRTLWVSGDEDRWYPDQPRWWKYVGRAPQDLDAVTGASTQPGDRTVIRIEVEDEVLDAGYSIRVDTSVEDLHNYPVDVETPLVSDTHGDKIEGMGYVRYIRFRW